MTMSNLVPGVASKSFAKHAGRAASRFPRNNTQFNRYLVCCGPCRSLFKSSTESCAGATRSPKSLLVATASSLLAIVSSLEIASTTKTISTQDRRTFHNDLSARCEVSGNKNQCIGEQDKTMMTATRTSEKNKEQTAASSEDHQKEECSYDVDKDPHRLIKRFVSAQKATYKQALEEICNGRKQGHWSWYIFPTPPYFEGPFEAGSPVNIYYSLRTDAQAVAYLKLPPVDGVHLRSNYIGIMKAIVEQLETNPELTLGELIGGPDEPKLMSSLEYFLLIAKEIDDEEVYQVCAKTLRVIGECESRPGPWQRWMTKMKGRLFNP